jgi:DNA-binding MarR family transcriptional regulator
MLPPSLDMPHGKAGPVVPKTAGANDGFPDLARRASALYRDRRLRERVMPSGLFGEPAWDVLLDLFVATEENRDISVSSACVAACVPPTTALRWIGMLEKRGLVARVDDARDHRRTFLRLSPKGYQLMTRYLLSDWFVAP